MGFIKKIWVDRSTEFPNRRKETAVAGQADTYDYTRAEGTIFAEGTKPDATNLNGLEGRIEDAFNDVDASINGLHGTVLWANSNESPGSTSFSGQTVTLSETIDNFNYYEVEHSYANNLPLHRMTTGKISTSDTTIMVNGVSNGWREVPSVPSGTSFTFGDGSSSGVINNLMVIPIKIIGYKTK